MSTTPSAFTARFSKLFVRVLACATTLAVLVMAPSVSHATMITQEFASGPFDTDLYTDNSGVGPYGVNPVTNVPYTPFTQFNPTLGTLNSVTVTLKGDISSILTYTNMTPVSPNPGDNVTVTTNAHLNIDFSFFDAKGTSGVEGDDALLYQVLGLSTSTVALSDAPGGSGDSKTATASLSKTLTYNTVGGVAPFKGTGSFFYFVTTGNGSVTSTNGNARVRAQTQGSWDITLAYDYTPSSPVPEPSSMALLGLGCAALACCRRFRRARARQ